MDAVAIEKRYEKLMKNYLVIAGIWPYQSKSTKYASRFIICTLGVISMIVQVAQLVYFFSLDALIEQCPIVLGTVIMLTKESTYIIKETKFRMLLDGIFNDCATDKSEEELAIMASYLQRAAIFKFIYLVPVYISTLVFLQLPWLPRIADILMPLNTSRPLVYIFSAYYFVDSDKHYYPVIAHMSAVIIASSLVCITCDTCYICTVHHACSLLAITGHRFKHAIGGISEGKKIEDSSNEAYRRVCFSIQAHERAMGFLEEFDDIYSGYLFICMGIVIVAFSVTLVMVSRLKIGPQFYMFSFYLTAQLTHLFFLTFQGQFIINSNDQIYNKIYEGLWYNTKPKTQTLYILALARTKVYRGISAGGLITMNLSSFADIVKTSFSYFTVLKTTCSTEMKDPLSYDQ